MRKNTKNSDSVLNNYLVDFFNGILRIEENSLQSVCNELSLREMHTIEAVINCDEGNLSTVAARLNITMGTLSVALKTLEKKGYIVRERAENDRRQINVSVTEKGLEVNNRHKAFHHNMVNEIISELSGKELDVLLKGLDKLNKHFDTLNKLPD